MLLKGTYQEVWKRGEVYAGNEKVKITKSDEQLIDAIVLVSTDYSVMLKFAPNGMGKTCDCPYFQKNGYICKHIVAAAIVWDERRGLARPQNDEVERIAAPPPSLSRRDIDNLFKHPLQADLEKVRILAEETALGGYVKPHSRLPKLPNMITDERQPLTLKEIKKCFTKIRSWTRRRNFDPYFCAGEMVAAICEMLRIAKKRLAVTPIVDAVQILLASQRFNQILVTELIDDSQGLHEISEVHLEDLYDDIRADVARDQIHAPVEKLLDEYRRRRGEY